MKYLSNFQIDFLNTVRWFIINKGEYSFSKKYIYQQYSEVLSPIEIDDEIGYLLQERFIIKSSKKCLIENRFITKINFTYNSERISLYNEAVTETKRKVENVIESARKRRLKVLMEKTEILN